MKRYKKWLSLFFVLTLIAVSTGCEAINDLMGNNTPLTPPPTEAPQETPEAVPTVHIEPLATELMPQFLPLQEGEDIAVITTSMGEIRMRFFPEFAPHAVENFITLARDGYYNDIIFHRVINQFMIQSGDPTGTGHGGSSVFGDGFDTEVTTYLHFFRGAVGMARDEDFNSNGSQFFILQNNQLDEYYIEVFEEYKENQEIEIEGTDAKLKDFYPTIAIDRYLAEGGWPDLNLLYTVFAQVYEGMDVVDMIAEMETDEDDKPLEDVRVLSIEIMKYE